MTETELKNLQIARKCLLDGDDQGATDHYLAVHDENADNPEAEYFVYNTLCTNYIDQGESNENKKLAFVATSKTLVDAVKCIAASDCTKEEKLHITARFVGMYCPIAAYIVKVPVMDASTRIQMAVTTLYAAGNAIESAYSGDTEAMHCAAMAWKDGVKLQQQFYAYSYDGNKAEDYVAKIQKVQPDYVMPKKAGCISLG